MTVPTLGGRPDLTEAGRRDSTASSAEAVERCRGWLDQAMTAHAQAIGRRELIGTNDDLFLRCRCERLHSIAATFSKDFEPSETQKVV